MDQTSAHHHEPHLIHRVGWLRAAVLGANDGIASVASILVGVAASGASTGAVIVAGVAGLVAGAFSMAAGEYVSVSSQTDTEQADLAREKLELERNFDGELEELAAIYVARGIDPQTAHSVARQLMETDALGAHARDELGLTEISTANPLQAALASAASFAAGAALPMIVAALTSGPVQVPAIAVATLVALAVLGALGAQAGGASLLKGAARVTVWGAIAMAATFGVGALVGTAL